MKKLQDCTKKELNDAIKFAEHEMVEWNNFIVTVKRALKKYYGKKNKKK